LCRYAQEIKVLEKQKRALDEALLMKNSVSSRLPSTHKISRRNHDGLSNTDKLIEKLKLQKLKLESELARTNVPPPRRMHPRRRVSRISLASIPLQSETRSEPIALRNRRRAQGLEALLRMQDDLDERISDAAAPDDPVVQGVLAKHFVHSPVLFGPVMLNTVEELKGRF
jgi:hypothetical protein